MSGHGSWEHNNIVLPKIYPKDTEITTSFLRTNYFTKKEQKKKDARKESITSPLYGANFKRKTPTFLSWKIIYARFAIWKLLVNDLASGRVLFSVGWQSPRPGRHGGGERGQRLRAGERRGTGTGPAGSGERVPGHPLIPKTGAATRDAACVWQKTYSRSSPHLFSPAPPGGVCWLLGTTSHCCRIPLGSLLLASHSLQNLL